MPKLFFLKAGVPLEFWVCCRSPLSSNLPGCSRRGEVTPGSWGWARLRLGIWCCCSPAGLQRTSAISRMHCRSVITSVVHMMQQLGTVDPAPLSLAKDMSQGSLPQVNCLPVLMGLACPGVWSWFLSDPSPWRPVRLYGTFQEHKAPAGITQGTVGHVSAITMNKALNY